MQTPVIHIKYKLVGGPFHRQVFFDNNLPPLIYVHGKVDDETKDEFYRFSEMRGHNYYVYTWFNACSDVELVSVVARNNTGTSNQSA